jgi:branched-chain amino acid transport system ATP-binding protein
LLRVKKIRKNFGGQTALDDVSFDCDAGEIVALVGPNGAGKTTLFNVITGVMRPELGQVFFDGRQIVGKPVHSISRLGITRTFQEVHVFGSLSLLDNIGVLQAGATHTRISYDALGRSNSDRPPIQGLQVKEIMAFLGLESDLAKRPMDLSYGKRKLLTLAMAILSDAKILLLDEPISGVDQGMIPKVKTLLKSTVVNQKRCILIIEHNLYFVREASTRAVVMSTGRVVAEGDPSVIFQSKDVLQVFTS